MFFFHVLEDLDFLAQFLQLGLLLIQFLDIGVIEIGVLLESLHVLADTSMLRSDLGSAVIWAQLHHALQRVFHFEADIRS